MPNIFDYMEWRGDLTLDEAPLCEVDNLAFSVLAYVRMEGLAPAPGKGYVPLREIAKEYFFTHTEEKPSPLGLMMPGTIITLFRRMSECPRYADLLIGGYVNEICEERVMQFSAMTILLPDESRFVAFRGTDDTLAGWREDFNLSFMTEIPSQRKATDYIDALDLPPDSRLYLGGHSKGGNLAVYAAVHASERTRRHIRRVFSNDGPGFTEEFLQSEAYRSIADRVCRLQPESSIVGLLLENDGVYTVIKSSRRGYLQHDGLSWEVKGSSFVRSEGLSKRGVHVDTVIRERVDSMSREEKATLVRLMFTILESTGAKTLTDIYNDGPRAALAMLKTYTGMTAEDRETTAYLWGKLFGSKTPTITVKAPPKPKSIVPPLPGERKRRREQREREGKITFEWFPLLHEH